MKLKTWDKLRTAFKLYCLAVGASMLLNITNTFLNAYNSFGKQTCITINQHGEAGWELAMIGVFWVFVLVLVADWLSLFKKNHSLHKTKKCSRY